MVFCQRDLIVKIVINLGAAACISEKKIIEQSLLWSTTSIPVFKVGRNESSRNLSTWTFPPHATYPPWLASRNLSTCEGAVTALLWCSASSAPGSLFVSGGIPFVSRDAPGYCCWGRLLGSGQKSILCRHLNSSLALQQTSHGLPGQMGWRQTNIHGSTFCPCMICFCYISLRLPKIGQNLISAGHWDQYITLH